MAAEVDSALAELKGLFDCSDQAILLNEERAEALHMDLMLIILLESG